MPGAVFAPGIPETFPARLRRVLTSGRVVVLWPTGPCLAGLWPPGPEWIWPRGPQGSNGLRPGGTGLTRPDERAGCGLVAHRATSSGPVAPRARMDMASGATGLERLWPRGPQGLNGLRPWGPGRASGATGGPLALA